MMSNKGIDSTCITINALFDLIMGTCSVEMMSGAPPKEIMSIEAPDGVTHNMWCICSLIALDRLNLTLECKVSSLFAHLHM